MSERAVPYHCPYCGETTLFPFAGSSGPDGAATASASGPSDAGTPPGWECRSCLRAFAVRMLGMVRRPARTEEGTG